MNELQIFSSEQFGQVRTQIINSEPWFVGKDIAEALGYYNTNDALIRHVDYADRANLVIHDGRQERTMVGVNESGLYAMIFGSKLETALTFKRWVTSEVLPSIRKHGMYATDELLDNPDLLIKVATALKEERERNKVLSHEVQVKTQIIGELKPKADYLDKILKNPGVMTITQIAKDYGLSGKAMNGLLHDKGIQYKQSGQWLLYSEYHDKGYTHSHTVEFERSDGRADTKLNTKWTQKGRIFIYNLLKEDGILPVIEKAA